MVHEYIRPAPEPKGKSDPIFAERLSRTQRAFKAKGFSYFPEDYITVRKDAIENENQAFQKEYGGSCVRKKLISITRVALPESRMFEDDKGDLDEAHRIKSALVCRIQCEILNEDALRRDKEEVLIDHRAAQHTFLIGRILTPVTAPVYKDGKLVAYRISNFNHVYFVPDTPAEIQRILEKYGRPSHQFTVAVARKQGPVYNNEAVFAVYNDADFVAPDVSAKDRGQNILNLIGANQKGFLGKGESNGVERYLEAMARLTKKGLTSKEIDELDVDTLRNVLANKKSKKLTA